MTDKLKVADNFVVSLDYTLKLDSGEVLDSSQGRGPLEFLYGQGQIIPGLESELQNMAIGDEKDVVVAPADGYGEYDEEDVQLIPHHVFPENLKLSEGMELQVRDEETGEPIESRVAKILPDGVVLDFNHPLAGKALNFQVKIVDLRPATGEELAHGHVHGAAHAH